MQEISQTENTASYVMTSESVAAYIQHEIDRGASKDSIRNFKRVTNSLFEWLPEDKTITKDRLLDWRQFLKDHGYTPQTELNYVKGINRYLDYTGCSDIRFNRGRAKDIAGKQFGYLTAIEPTGEKNRKDYVWRCRCKCGKQVEYPATRLLLGNTVSCGCLRGAHFKEVNKYIGGTSLRQSLDEQVHSTKAMSGYTGVHRKREKWAAKITFQKVTYQLGSYESIEEAIAIRQEAEKKLRDDPHGFSDWVQKHRQSGKQEA